MKDGIMNENIMICMRAKPGDPDVKAVADVTLEFKSGNFTIPGIKVIERKGSKPQVLLPIQRRNNTPGNTNVPLSQVFNKNIEELVLEEYEHFT